jgi:hypothetical protein
LIIRKFVLQEPILSKRIDHLVKVEFVSRLSQKGICAQCIRSVHLPDFFRTAEHNNEQALNRQFGANPFEDSKSVHSGHVQIQEQNAWKRVLRPIREFSFSFQISHCPLAGVDLVKRINNSDPFKRPAKQESVISIVVDEQYDSVMWHKRFARPKGDQDGEILRVP